MTRTVWRSIIATKDFYRGMYRRLCTWIIFSVLLNIILLILIGYFYENRHESVFYATNGTTSPISLQALNTPNYSTEYLLPPDPILLDTNRDLPD